MRLRLLRDDRPASGWMLPEDDGSFAFEHVAAGAIRVEVEGDTYAPTTSEPIDLGEGEARRGVVVPVWEGARIVGRAVGPREVRERSDVYLVWPTQPARVDWIGDGSDRFLVAGLPADTYEVVLAEGDFRGFVLRPGQGDEPRIHARKTVTVRLGEVEEVELLTTDG